MGNSCSIDAFCKNKKGEVVESKLWLDLKTLTGNRQQTKELYAIGTNPEFLNRVQGEIKLDENGQITVKSLLKAANISIEDEKALKGLNKLIKEGVYEYDEAITRLTNFARNNPISNKYMGIIKKNSDGKYKLEVVKKTRKAKDALFKEISNRSLMEQMVYYLKSNGVETEFLEKNRGFNGRYSTENAVKIAEGLYNLIQIFKHGEHPTESMAEETGHFIVSALGNSALVKRLEKALTPEVYKRLMGENYDENKVYGSSLSRERAGDIVGKALLKTLDKKSNISGLANRIITTAKKVFYKLTGQKVKSMMLDAQLLANEMVKDFLSENFSGSLETALLTKETLFDAEYSNEVKAFRFAYHEMKQIIRQLKAIEGSQELIKAFKNLVKIVELDATGTASKNFDVEVSATADALLGMVQMTEQLTNALVKAEELLRIEKSSQEDDYDFNSNYIRNGQILNQVRVILYNTSQVATTISRYCLDSKAKSSDPSIKVTVKKADGTLDIVDLTKIVENLTTMTARLTQIYDSQAAYYSDSFYAVIYGKDFVVQARRVLYDWGWKNRKHGFIKVQEASKEPIKAVLTHVRDCCQDSNLIQKWAGMPNQKGNIILELEHKAIAAARQKITRVQESDWEQLMILKADLKAATGSTDTSWCFETDENGELTGNLISELDYGRWNSEFHEFKEQCKKEFQEKYPDWAKMSSTERGILWDKFFSKRYEIWHNGDPKNIFDNPPHSTYDEDNDRYIPLPGAYTNEKYERLTDAQIKWLKRYKEFYSDLKKRRLGDETKMPDYRAPQFGARMIDMWGSSAYGSITDRIKTSMGDKISRLLGNHPEDFDYGDDNTENEDENPDGFWSNLYGMEQERSKKIPLFGVKRMPNPKKISTDLFYSTSLFGSMAIQYRELSLLQNGLVIMADSMQNNRKETGVRNNVSTSTNSDYSQSLGMSRVNQDYMKFLDRQLYGVKIPIRSKWKPIVKAVKLVTRIAATTFLYGNVGGGVANLNTGIISNFIGSLKSTHYNHSDFYAAQKWYIEYIWEHLAQLGSNNEDDMMTLWARKFGITAAARDFATKWHPKDSILRDLPNMLGWGIYEGGDHWMQFTPYLMKAHNTVLYKVNEDGSITKTNMLKAYKRVKNTDELGNYKKERGVGIRKNTSYGHSLVLDGVYLKPQVLHTIVDGKDVTKTTPMNQIVELYNMLNSIIDKAVASKNATSFFSTPGYSDEETELLDSLNVDMSSPDKILVTAKELMSTIVWGENDELEYTLMCRTDCNEFHGIYDDLNATDLQTYNFYTQALTSMKGYALGYMEKYFATDHFVAVAGENREGMHQSMTKLMLSLWSDAAKSKRCALALSALFSTVNVGNHTKVLEDFGFSKYQIGNMRCWTGTLAVIILQALLKMSLADDDDDDEQKTEEEQTTAYRSAAYYYFVSRALQEQMAYFYLVSMAKEGKNITSLLPASVSLALTTSDIVEGFVMTRFFDYKDPAEYQDLSSFDNWINKNYYYNNSKENIYEKGDAKWKIKLLKNAPLLKSYMTAKDPREAAKAYDFNRNTH